MAFSILKKSVLFILMPFILLTACTIPKAQSEVIAEEATEQIEKPIELAHDFSLPTLDGTVLTLSDYRGEYVLINFWATWCVWCVEEMPYLQEVADSGQIHVWGINMRETVDEMNEFTEQYGISFPILLSPDNETILAYPGGMPRTFIVGPDGNVVYTIFGPINPESFDAWLETNLQP